MKKLLFFIFIPLLLACEGPMGPAGRDGYDGKDGLENYWRKVTIEVQPTDWKTRVINSELNNYKEYFVEVYSKDLDELAFDEGIVVAYWLGDNSKQALPCSVFYEDKNEGLWLETLNFSYSRTGWMELSFTNNAGFRPINATLYFEVIITSPN